MFEHAFYFNNLEALQVIKLFGFLLFVSAFGLTVKVLQPLFQRINNLDALAFILQPEAK